MRLPWTNDLINKRALARLLKENFQYEDEVDGLKDQIDLLQTTINDADSDMQEFELAIRHWHDREHDDGWAFCQHEICRTAIGYS